MNLVGAANLAAATASGAYGTGALALGPWAYYRHGEAAGAATMLDTSANARHGSYIGTPLFGQAALVQDAGGDTGIRLQDDGSYGLAPPFSGPAFTLVTTIHLVDVTPQSVIAAQDQSLPDDGWSLECLAGKLRGYIRSGPGTGTAQWIGGSTTGFGTLVAGQRHTVAMTFGAAGAELWIDGARVAHDAALTDAPVANGADIGLGSYFNATGIADGFLDESIIFARQLSSGEHATLARPATASGAYGTGALALGPWAYYRHGEAAGAATMLDTSANARHGSYIGTPLFGQAALVQDAGGDTGIRLQDDGSYGLAPPFSGPAFTLVTTIHLVDVTPQSVIAAQDQSLPDDGWSLECLAGKLRGYIRSGPGTGTAQWIGGSTTGFGTLVAGQRHTVAMTFGAAGAELWIDGTRVAHDAALTDAPVANGADISLGSYFNATGIADGFLDESIIFARQLSSGEHATLARPDTVTIPPPVAQDHPVTGRHAVTAGTAQQFFTVLANDTGADDIDSVSTPSPNIGTAVRNAGPPIRIGYTPPASVASATNVDVSHQVSGPGGTDTAVLRLTVNPVSSGAWGTYVTGLGNFARTPPTKPAYRTAFYDPDFGCRIVRVGLTPGASVPNAGGTAPTWHRHSYSNKQMWNADESILGLWFLSSGGNGFSGFYFMDGHTYEMFPWGRRSVPSGGQRAADMFWHPKDPERLIGIRNSSSGNENQLYFYRPRTNETETIATFSSESGLRFTSTGSPSDADGVDHPRVWLRRGTSSGAAGFVYDIETDTKFPTFIGTAADWSGMDHTGDFVFSHSSSSSKVQNVNGGTEGSFGGPSKHADLVWNAARTEQYVVFHSGGDFKRLDFPSLSNLTTLISAPDPDHASGRHIIPGNAYQGWAIGWGTQNSNTGVLEYEVFAVRLAEPHTVRRLAHIYSWRDDSPGSNYPSEVHPSISPSGTRMIFASRWSIGSQTVIETNVQAYVIETFDYLNPVSGRILGS